MAENSQFPDPLNEVLGTELLKSRSLVSSQHDLDRAVEDAELQRLNEQAKATDIVEATDENDEDLERAPVAGLDNDANNNNDIIRVEDEKKEDEEP